MFNSTFQRNVMKPEEIESILNLYKYYGIKANHNRPITMWILFLIFWLDLSWSLYILSQRADTKNCLFIDVGCLALPETPLCLNLAWLNYRTILFTLFNYWFFSNQEWLRSVSEIYSELKAKNLLLETKKIRKKFHRPYWLSIGLAINYAVVYDSMAQNRSNYELIIVSLHIALPTYFLGFFFIENYLLNNVCIELFRQFTARFTKSLQLNRNDYDLIKTFYNLYLLIVEAKKFFYVFFILSATFLFCCCLCLYYCVVYSNLFGFNRLGIGIMLITVIFYLVYISWFTGKIDQEAEKLSRSMYEIVNLRIFRQSNTVIDRKFIIELSKMMATLNRSMGVEIIGQSINATTIVKFITLFFSFGTLIFK
ncbi:hypothetical protein NH340_JMT01251 [Sarcoptes scabiei]|nr:hypothetical protein NH340_JMT01251 [Sarcoptes scabiei]